jgi:hypothetical protein
MLSLAQLNSSGAGSMEEFERREISRAPVSMPFSG